MTRDKPHTASPSRATVHVAIAFDRNYLMPFHALLTSLLVNRRSSVFDLHLIVSGLEQKDKAEIESIVRREGSAVHFYEPDLIPLDQLVRSGTWTSAVYYRLLFPFVVGDNVRKLVYLDCDTLVLGDLSELFNVDLQGYPLAAVSDSYVPVQPLIGITEPGEYFNSGVMVMDLDVWRRMQISEQTLEYLKAHPERIKFVDQCGLNAVLKGRWRKMESRYNLLYSSLPPGVTRKEAMTLAGDAIVVHFTLQRPWNMLCRSPLRHLYFNYLKKSKRIRFSLEGYSDFSLSKIPAWIQLRATEFYLSKPFLRSVRAFFK